MSSRDNVLSGIIKVLFCVSLPFVCLILSTNASVFERYLGSFFSFYIAIFLSFKFDFYSIIKRNFNFKYFLCSLFIVRYLEKIFFKYGSQIIDYFFSKLVENHFGYGMFILKSINIIFYLFLFPALFIFVYLFLIWLIPKILNFLKNLSKFERRFIIIVTGIGFILILIVYNLTNCFYAGVYDNKNVNYDVVYTSDSGALFLEDAYLNFSNSENDLRQPLFGVFALPFGMIAKGVSNILFFIPNSYAIVLATIQLLLLEISLILIMRMLKLKGIKALLFSMLILSSYSYVLFIFLMEQYIISLFYLILTIYMGYMYKKEVNYYYIGAVGTLLTSGIMFPLICKFKNFKYWFKNIFSCFCYFFITVIITGQLSTFIHFFSNYKKLGLFFGDTVLLSDRLKQFLYFVRSIFVAPKGDIVFLKNIPRYFMDDVSFVSVFGIFILIICVVSFILNKKNRVVRISFGWVLFSFLILCLLGWGTMENGLILYSLYFSWAYLILVYLFIDKIIKNNKLKISLILVVVILMLIINCCGFYEILKFGIKYYGI